MTNSNRREEVQKLILALLVTHKEAVDIVALENEYMDQMGERVPWRSFGYVSLLDFLQNMSHIRIERRYNKHYVRALPTEKSNHISSLVANQRAQPKKRIVNFRTFRPSHYYPRTERPKIRMSAEVLSSVVKLVKQHPKGITKDFVLQTVNKNYPYVNICLQDFEDQLRELSHEIAMEDNMIYPARTNECTSKDKNQVATEQTKGPPPCQVPSPRYYVSDGDDSFDDYDSDDNTYCSTAFAQYVSSSRLSSCIDKKTTCSFLQESVTKQQERLNNNSEYFDANGKEGNTNENRLHDKTVQERINDDVIPLDDNNAQILVNDRLKFRLEKLIQKYSNGIWCAQLPETFLKEYNMELKYTELGFNSVREFASQLKDIFHCVQHSSTGDCILYNAKEVIPTNEKTQRNSMTLTELHCMQFEDDVEAMPAIVSTDTSKKLIPECVMTIGETVGQICVESLMNDVKPFVEVYVVEVFTPSFFWVQLRKKKKTFDALMAHLDNFYTEAYKRYAIPPVVLEKGLNCACVYGGVWHRGIIKSVKPDLQVTVLFYDYGTVKTYPGCNIYYLDRKFSYLPAQAIPCGLINTQPKDSDHWPKPVTYAFAMKTSQIPLVATIGAIDVDNNSMMVTLTNTLEDEDVHINDWLVEQNLAVHGTMVRIRCRNFPFLYYVKCREILKRLTKISEDYEKDVKSVNKLNAEGIRETIALCDSRTVLKSSDNLYKTRFDYIDTHHPSKLRPISGLSNRSVKSETHCGNSTCASMNVEVTSTNSASTPSGPKELRGLLEKVLSSNTTRNSSGFLSATLRSKVSASELDSKTSKSHITKFVKDPHSTISLSTHEKPIISNEAKKSKDLSNVQVTLHDIEDKQMKFHYSHVSEKPTQEFTDDFVPLKRSEYRFSPTNSVIDDANNDKFFGQFRSTCGGRGAMAPIDWSIINSNNAPEESKNFSSKPLESCEAHSNIIKKTQPNIIQETQPNIIQETQPNIIKKTQPNLVQETQPNLIQETQPKIIQETQPNIIKKTQPNFIQETLPNFGQETRNTSSSENSLPLANSEFLNTVHHCLQPTDEAVYRRPYGNINKHHSVSELVLRRRKIYIQNDDRIIGLPQKILNVFRGTTLKESELVPRRQVDSRKSMEHKHSDKENVQYNGATIVNQFKHCVDDTVLWDFGLKKESSKCAKHHKDEIENRKSEGSNSSSEVLPESSNSSNTTSENIVSSENVSNDHLLSEFSLKDNAEQPQVQEKLCTSENSINEDFGELESMPEEIAKNCDISTDNVAYTDCKATNSAMTSKTSTILEIMKRYKNVEDRDLDSDDLSSEDESDNFDHLTCSYIINKSLQINGIKQKSDIADEFQPVDENLKLICQSTELKAEQNHEEQLQTQEAASDTVITDKSNSDEHGDYDKMQEIQKTATVTASLPVYAPVFNDVDIDSEDDDEWDAFMDSFDTQTVSQFSRGTEESNQEESDSGLKIEELDDTDMSADGKQHCSPHVPKTKAKEKQMNVVTSNTPSNTPLIVSEEKSLTKYDVTEKTEVSERKCLESSNNTVRDNTHWSPHGKRRTLEDLLNKVKSAIV